jgi:hypothetical protein
MLKASTLIAMIGCIAHFGFFVCLNAFKLFESEVFREYYNLTLVISFFVIMVSLVQFFIVFYIKLSVTKK